MPSLVRLSGCTSMFNFLYALATLGLSFRPIPNMFLQSHSLHARIPATVWAKWMSASVGGTTSVGLGEAVPASAVDGPVGAVVAGSNMAAQAGDVAAAVRGAVYRFLHHCVPNTYEVWRWVHMQSLLHEWPRAMALGHSYSVCSGQTRCLAAMVYVVAMEIE